MEYYIISLIFTIIFFGIIQYFEYNKINNEIEYSNEYIEPYSLFKTNNYLLFAIIYLVLTIIAYYLYSSNFKLFSLFDYKKNEQINKINNISEPSIKEEINPQILSKINDNFDIGFDPFNSDDTSNSSLSSKE